jgi:hypothetical protein
MITDNVEQRMKLFPYHIVWKTCAANIPSIELSFPATYRTKRKAEGKSHVFDASRKLETNVFFITFPKRKRITKLYKSISNKLGHLLVS